MAIGDTWQVKDAKAIEALGCFCKPGPCHGDVIATWVEDRGADPDPFNGEDGPEEEG